MGKLKGKVTTSGDKGMLKYTDASGAKVECAYDQPFSLELGIGDNTRVSFDVVAADAGNMAVSVAPINKGSITDISVDNGSGTITETESGIKYPFRQNYLAQSRFALNQVVTYNLVYSNGTLYAVCLTALAN
jgi:carbohydrate-binding DOMON domain-containing protein